MVSEAPAVSLALVVAKPSTGETAALESETMVNPSASHPSCAAFAPSAETAEVSDPLAHESDIAEIAESGGSPRTIAAEPEPETVVASPCSPRVLASDAVPLNSRSADAVVLEVSDGEDLDVKAEEEDESPGSAVKRSLQQLLDLEDPADSSSASAEVERAKETLATWVAKPFDLVQDYGELTAIYEAIVTLLRACPAWESILILASNQVKDLRDTLGQYHDSINHVPEASQSLSKYERSVSDKAKAVAAGKKSAEDFEKAQMEVNRLERELDLARSRRDAALLKVNDHLSKAKAADTTVRSLQGQLPALRSAANRPSLLRQVAAGQHASCVAIIRDLVKD